MAPLGLLAAALVFAGRGRRVLPTWWLREDGSCGCGGQDTCRPGKHPVGALVPNGVHNATKDAPTITSWWTTHSRANIGLAMGDGVVAIDIDPRSGGDETFRRIQAEHGEIGRTPRAHTGGRGEHVFVQVENEFHTTKLPGGIDLIGDGSYVLAAPSMTTGPYEWIVAPWEAPLVWAPPWVLAAERRRGEAPVMIASTSTNDAPLLARARAYLAKMDPAISGCGGHLALWNATFALVCGFGLSGDDALGLLVADYNARCAPHWSLKDLRHKVDDAIRARGGRPPWLANSSLANQEGASQWGGSFRATVRNAAYDPLPARNGRAVLHQVRLGLTRRDGLSAPNQFVVLPLPGHHENARGVFDATIGDLGPSEAWMDPTQRNRLASRVLGRELEIVLRTGQRRATRMRRTS